MSKSDCTCKRPNVANLDHRRGYNADSHQMVNRICLTCGIALLAQDRDALAADNLALREDAELFRWMETHVAAWHCKDAALPRFVVDPRFADETGEEYSLIVTGTDGVGTVSLRTSVLMMRKSKTENAIDLARTPAATTKENDA